MWEWIFRLQLRWALANPDALQALLTSQATEIVNAGGKFIAQCNDGGN
jgi:hypothetical protein